MKFGAFQELQSCSPKAITASGRIKTKLATALLKEASSFQWKIDEDCQNEAHR